jgi:hypothetical protein
MYLLTTVTTLGRLHKQAYLPLVLSLNITRHWPRYELWYNKLGNVRRTQ